MQPTFRKYGIRKRPDDWSSNHSEEKHNINAGKVSSANVSESGGGEVRPRSKSKNSRSNSPYHNEDNDLVTPNLMKSVFQPIQEDSKETISGQKQKKKLKKSKDKVNNRYKDIKVKDKATKGNLKDDRAKRKKVNDIGTDRLRFKKPKTQKKIISKKVIKKPSKKNSIDVTHKKQQNKINIKEYMKKKDREYRHQQNQKYKEEEQKQRKVYDNLRKLAKKRKKLVKHPHNSRSTLYLQTVNATERSELGMTMNKNSSMLKSSSKYTLSNNKLTKTQRKPKTRKIKEKVDSPSKLLSSDSELDELSPQKYLEY